ncbi:MAG: hypothetical protein HY329_26160 [Chloroflexi bacterium]|nr:hypothetical protein [Chloroflexota bacterium]
MGKLWLKCCPRCRGDLVLYRELEETYVQCLQCGHTLNSEEERVMRTNGTTRAA